MFLILGAVPYAIVGLVVASMGYNYTTWQFWVIIACMLANLKKQREV